MIALSVLSIICILVLIWSIHTEQRIATIVSCAFAGGTLACLLGFIIQIERNKHRQTTAWRYTEQANDYLRTGREDDALDELGKALELAPDLLHAAFMRGTIYQKRERYQAAVTDYTTFLHHPDGGRRDRAAAFRNRARCFWNLKRFKEAREDVQMANQMADGSYFFTLP